MRVERSFLLILAAAACGHPHPPPAAPAERIKLVTLPVESDAFPKIAKAATGALAQAKVAGVDDSVLEKVSIEVVQLSIECVDPTVACYAAAAKSLSANKLLFAQVDVDGKKPRIEITLFDATTRAPRTTARTFDTEAAALGGLDQLLAEATR